MKPPARDILFSGRRPIDITPISNYAKNEITSATTNPDVPTSVSITVQLFNVVFSSIWSSDFTSQKPESLK